MKRSKNISLAIMGAMLVASPCAAEEAAAPKVFKTQEECVTAGNTAEECARMEAEAKKNAPKFATREECEKQFGAEMCSGGKNSSGGSFFTPLLMGFMAGHLLGGNSAAAPAQGLYNNPANPGQFQTGQGQPVAAPANTAAAARTAAPAKAATAAPASSAAKPQGTVTRRGFLGGGRSIGA